MSDYFYSLEMACQDYAEYRMYFFAHLDLNIVCKEVADEENQ